MKETSKSSSLYLQVHNPETNETFGVHGTKTETSKYFSISKITSRINNMDYLTVLEVTCTSSKDIYIFRELIETADSNNIIIIPNVTKKAKQLDVSRAKLNKIIKAMVDNDFLYKDEVQYFINPYVFIGKRVRSNEKREELQVKWTKLLKRKNQNE